MVDGKSALPISYLRAIYMIPLHNPCSLKEAMAVSERRYLKRNSTGLFNGKIFGVYSTEPIETFAFLCKHQIFYHILINR
jgi:hypothetical protein